MIKAAPMSRPRAALAVPVARVGRVSPRQPNPQLIHAVLQRRKDGNPPQRPDADEKQSGAKQPTPPKGVGKRNKALDPNLLEDEIRDTPAYRALDPDRKKQADGIIDKLRTRDESTRATLLKKLKILFTTKKSLPGPVIKASRKETAESVRKEKSRLGHRAAIKAVGLEEDATTRATNWLPVAGAFGGGTFYKSGSATDIVIKLPVRLVPAGQGTMKDVSNIELIEDAIEKAASAPGYVVDVEFEGGKKSSATNDPVKAADWFTIKVDPSKPLDATNWSKAHPRKIAHELHHLLGLKVDRYDYIEAHYKKASMTVEQRLNWFDDELDKPIGYNDKSSIIANAEHPNDRDICEVFAPTAVDACVTERTAGHRP